MAIAAIAAGVFLCLSQAKATEYSITPESIHEHLAVLASDSLEGREVGEIGEWKASRYIVSVFESLGLEPKGDSGSYRQQFSFTKRIELGPDNRLVLNGRTMNLREDYLPLDQSGPGTFSFDEVVPVGYGIVTDDSSYNDYAGKNVAGKAVLISRYSPETDASAGLSTDSIKADTNRLEKYSVLTDKVMTALNHEVSGIFFFTPPGHDDTIITLGVTRVKPKDVPIIFLRRHGLEKLGLNISSPDIFSASGETDLIRVRDTGYNVVAGLPGKSDTTVIIGAHYDHLGWGGPSSRYRGREKKIHYGADDNGSGTSVLLELARYFSARKDSLRHSLLFITFSGEETGLLGSTHYVRNWTIDRSLARMMINMDMIGRLNRQEKGLMVMGVGTCPEFSEYFSDLDTTDLKITLTESGAGPSDHAAFYHDSIPVLNFFTGAHEDYHTPDDVIEKIDFDGCVTVANLVAGMISHFDNESRPLVFHRTKDTGEGRHRSSFSVTLGVMPDFISEVDGLRIDGVSPERPADRAGILKGDIIIQMGEVRIGDIYDYMNALGKFRLGDTANVILVRQSDTLAVEVEFK